MKRFIFIFSFLFIFFLGGCGTGDVKGTDDIHTPEEEQVVIEPETSDNEVDEIESHTVEEAADSEDASEEQTTTEELEELAVHFIDVGQADATLLQYSDDGETFTILYDTGDWRGNEVVPYLQAQGIDFIDLVIVSHPDADHIGQLDEVMKAFSVGEVWMSGNESSSQTFQRAVEAVLMSDADYYEPRAGDKFSIGPLSVDVLYPNSISGKSNEESISILFTYGNMKFVFTGDAGRKEEAFMRNQFNVAANVLHLGHHGSKTSSDPAFIDAVSPSIAVYSAGEGNSYGHPSPEVVSAIESRGIDLYGTDVHGTVIIKTDGQQLNVETTGKKQLAPKKQKTEKKDTSSDRHVESTEQTGDCIDINLASLEELQEIIHIGPVRAEELMELRPFSSVDDLQRIDGIGPARLADIKNEGKACVQ